MSNRRRLRPGELARQDQNLAYARDQAAADPNTLVMATEHVDGDEPCCWCDCPPEQHQHGETCEGCPAPADIAVVVWFTPEKVRRFPICQPHWPRFVADTNTMAGIPDKQVEFRVRPIHDEDQ